MKTVSADVLTILGTRNYFNADLYSFFAPNQSPLYYTSGDIDITANGNTYKCGGVTGLIIDRNSNSGGQRALCHWYAGLQVGTLQFDIIPRREQINGQPFLAACRKGVFDGADFRLERYVAANNLSGTIILFDGRVAEIGAGRSYATFQIADHRELLNQQLPKNLFGASCRWSFCDSGCTLNRANFTDTNSASSGSTNAIINTTLSAATGAYDQGSITFTTGLNAGLSRTVKTYTHGSPSTISLIAPFPDAPAAGDTFSILKGCARTVAACTAYSNLDNFGGTPFIPAATSAS